MKRRWILLIALLGVATIGGIAALVHQQETRELAAAISGSAQHVRPYSPIIGPKYARVTIVEFFDPACAACSASYPHVKKILALYPNDVRLVLRYAAFERPSAAIVRLLEAARVQGRFIPVLEALLADQARWTTHGAIDVGKAWIVAGETGLNTRRARVDSTTLGIEANLQQDLADANAANVSQTPAFFVNGRPLGSSGPQQLLDLVRDEVNALRSSPVSQ